MQSFTAIASQNHQIDLEHLQTTHSHADDAVVLTTSANTDHDVKDCHHCGHCNGTHLMWVAVKTVSTEPWFTSKKILSSSRLKPASYIETNFRPPILFL